MKKLLLALALLLAPTVAFAQNPTCPTRPAGNSTNACASTAFVQNSFAPHYPWAVAQGGTGQTSLTANAFLTGNGTSPINFVAITGLVLGNGASAPTAYAGTSCTNQFPRALSALGAATCASVAIGSDVSGLAAGIAAWLATPSSANLATAMTDETGTGALVFASGGTIAPKTNNTIRYASQFGGADWCANLVLAIADIGANPGTIIIDSNQTINACTGAGNILLGNDHTIKFVSGNIYTLNRTLQYGTHGTTIEGIGGGGNVGTAVTGGTVLKWTGGTGNTMVLMFDTSYGKFSQMGLDCNNTTSCVGIQINSDNSPISTNNLIENFEITGVHVGIIVGSANTSPTSGATCSGTPSTDGCTENDFFAIRQGQIYGNCADTTAEGIRVNSLNAAQNSVIDTLNIQCTNKGINIINMNDTFNISRVTSGSVIGAGPTQFVVGSGVVNGPDYFNDECEGTVICIDDQSTAGTQIWTGNQFNTTVSVTGGANIVSSSNIYGSTFTVGGTVAVTSLGDTGSAPTFSGSGRYIKSGNIAPVAVASLPSCVAGRKGQSQYVTDANATTFNAIVAGGGANVIRVGCDGTNWRIGN